ncbi:MAG: succinate CoA transferase [Verrucomicrobia bacterium]|nr:succinate CoA transferase [Verrucomicrobiota bacterium]MCH8526121.1 succinate CoA transferase [Kiritimatiellia bacterium]
MSPSQIVTQKRMTADEAAAMIHNGEVISTSGFTPAGYPKAIPLALAKRAEALHADGREFKVSLYTGASVGDELDGALARAKALNFRMPYQSNNEIRGGINSGEIEFVDFHLSHVAQYLRYGFIPKCTTVIVEAVEVTNDGKIYLSTSGGMSATFLKTADRIFIELNESMPKGLMGFHDVYLPKSPPNRAPLPIYHPGDRIGTPYVKVDPAKIAGIVVTDIPDKTPAFRAPDQDSEAIAAHTIDFLLHEQKMGRLPEHLPYQSGVGNVANAVLSGFATHPRIDPISLYTEVMQDGVFELIEADRLEMASTCSLTLSPAGQVKFRDNIDELKHKIIIRQQEMSNNPEVIRRLGVISMNTALEMDMFGHVNSTHVMGSKMMNGIGGSGDFCRNAYISIFMTPSVAKNGDISAVVPMVSHCDHNEHSVQVMVTEQGLADLRGLSPVRRARLIIEKCAHPDYKEVLTDYLEYGLKHAPSKHTPHVLANAFSFHQRFLETGSMKISGERL